MNKIIIGKPEAFFETGTEGIYWAVYEDGKQGYDALNIIENGNHLKIIDQNNNVMFDGIVKLDFKNFYHNIVNDYYNEMCKLPKGAIFPQHNLWGFWVHGVPTNYDHDDWLYIFMYGNGKYGHTYTCYLTKHEQ